MRVDDVAGPEMFGRGPYPPLAARALASAAGVAWTGGASADGAATSPPSSSGLPSIARHVIGLK